MGESGEIAEPHGGLPSHTHRGVRTRTVAWALARCECRTEHASLCPRPLDGEGACGDLIGFFGADGAPCAGFVDATGPALRGAIADCRYRCLDHAGYAGAGACAGFDVGGHPATGTIACLP